MRLYRDFTSQEEIDAEYDIESVLDMASYGALLQSTGQELRNTTRHHLGVPYGPTRDEYIDIFPASRPGAPVLIFIHGGWWRSMASGDFHMVAKGPVERGVTVVMVNYSLCPKVTISEITRQNRAALAWVHQNISQFNGNPAAIFVSGHSAGGHQVAMLSLTAWGDEYGLPADIIRGGIPISGLFDLRPFRYSWLQPKLQLTHEVIERESPIFHVDSLQHFPPLLVTLGGDESTEFHRQSRAFVDAWGTAGGRASMFDQPGRDHISAITDLNDPHSAFTDAILDFISRELELAR